MQRLVVVEQGAIVRASHITKGVEVNEIAPLQGPEDAAISRPDAAEGENAEPPDESRHDRMSLCLVI